MFHWVLLITLFSYESLAFRLSNKIDADHRRWRRGAPAIATTSTYQETNPVPNEDVCLLEKGEIYPFHVFTKQGERTALVEGLPEPAVLYCPSLVRKEVSHTFPARFGPGKNAITYSFWYKVNGRVQRKIKAINFNVVVSECCNKTVNATVKPGETEAVVSWSEPGRTCPSYPKRDNPSTSGRFPIGIHRITYKYDYEANLQWPKLEMKCHVDVIVTEKSVGKLIARK